MFSLLATTATRKAASKARRGKSTRQHFANCATNVITHPFHPTPCSPLITPICVSGSQRRQVALPAITAQHTHASKNIVLMAGRRILQAAKKPLKGFLPNCTTEILYKNRQVCGGVERQRGRGTIEGDLVERSEFSNRKNCCCKSIFHLQILLHTECASLNVL